MIDGNYTLELRFKIDGEEYGQKFEGENKCFESDLDVTKNLMKRTYRRLLKRLNSINLGV